MTKEEKRKREKKEAKEGQKRVTKPRRKVEGKSSKIEGGRAQDVSRAKLGWVKVS
jgi:hypothetical protein